MEVRQDRSREQDGMHDAEEKTKTQKPNKKVQLVRKSNRLQTLYN